MKSTALTLLVEELGLASPERFVWGLRDRQTPTQQTNYSVIQLNYDPATLQPSRWVNGVLYNYRIFDDLGPLGGEWASAVEYYQLDPLFQPYSSVASGFGSSDFQLGASPDDFTSFVASGLSLGEYFRGLTRDDAGGLRYLLSTNNFAAEALLLDVFPSAKFASGSSPWSPYPIFGTNGFGTNNVGTTNILTGTNLTNFVSVAVRPGRDKLTFKRVNYDSLLSSTFTPITNRYRDSYLDPKTGRIRSQQVERVIRQPDILFAVDDLGTFQNTARPVLNFRTTTAGWSNNVALNSAVRGTGLGGPGVITPGIVIVFSDLVPYFLNDVPGTGELDGFGGFIWGSFDGSTKPPVVFPAFSHPLLPQLSLQYLQSIALHRNGF